MPKAAPKLLALFLCLAAIFILFEQRHPQEQFVLGGATTSFAMTDDKGEILRTYEPVEEDKWASDKGLAISELLREQPYLKFAMLVILPGEDGLYTYYAMLDGDGLEARVDEITALIETQIDPAMFDLERSYLEDLYGNRL